MRITELAERRAQLELTAMRPDQALTVLDQALPRVEPAARAALYALRERALLASHDISWEGPSMMVTYRPSPAPPPPPLAGGQPRPRLALASGARGAAR